MNETTTGFSDDQLFITLVTDLVTQAWIALGKWKHPVSDKLERNVPAAGIIIDMLDMLSRKTAGNRTDAEDRLLLDSLQQLKLNYVTESSKPDEPVVEEPEEKPADTHEAAKEPVQEDTDQSPAKQPTTSKAKSASGKKPAAKGAKKKTSSAKKGKQSTGKSAQEKHDT
ncbi:MAG: DUF1844 domain-containing protein [Fidelibacterota bacterium]|nr:MAG: DUF1844 domain-containing protein [Candidatus Neomarinimicrobiota bacterium]